MRSTTPSRLLQCNVANARSVSASAAMHAAWLYEDDEIRLMRGALPAATFLDASPWARVQRRQRNGQLRQARDWICRSRAEVRGLLSAADLEGLERQTASPRGTRP